MITSSKNPRLIQARKLAQRKYRLQQNRFLVEGLQLLGMAVEMMATDAGRRKIAPDELFYCEELFTGQTAPRLLARLTQAGAKAVPVAAPVLDTLSERDTSQGLAAAFIMDKLKWTLAELEPRLGSQPSLVLVLDRLQDPGNLGTLIRTADAAGAAGVILLEPCVDPFDPKTVRGSMGSIFTMPLIQTRAIEPLLARLSKLGYRLVGADARRGQAAWRGDALRGPLALVLGSEARGLSPELHAHLTDYVNLPLHGQAESLNVAVAGGVLMYEWLRLNSP
ncbi:MAG: RNA methyltransferase [Chloroflexota bacterium]